MATREEEKNLVTSYMTYELSTFQLLTKLLGESFGPELPAELDVRKQGRKHCALEPATSSGHGHEP